jgi:acetyl-CoA acetyltransferase/uncharacterized OB-fold protein
MHGPLPRLEPENEYFWTSGADGELRIQRCTSCGQLRHPATPICRSCRSMEFEHAVVSGKGYVLGYTINYQQWLPDMVPPYVVVVVGLAEDLGIRITANLEDVELDAVEVGMAVEVLFEHAEDVWLPKFRPSGEPALAELPEDDYRVFVRPPASTKRYEHDCAFTGVGFSQVGRRLMRDPLSLAVDACLAAIEDAGLAVEDIDGLATYPGGSGYAGGFSEGGVYAIEEALRIRPTWHNGVMETPGQAGSIVSAMLAVSAGLCKHVLCFRTVWETTHPARGGSVPAADGRVPSSMAERASYGAMSAANWIGMNASNYFKRYGADRSVLGRIATNNRAMAARNPRAIYKEPMTMDDYFAARMVTTPFGLYDCDVPCDGSVAIIVSAVDAAKDLKHTPVLIESVGTQIIEPVSWDQGTLSHEPQLLGQAMHMWTRTDLTPADVDMAQLYDGFSFNCLSWLESLGFCGMGEATDFIGDGSVLALDGALPLNTNGGQLSGGRLHGFGFLAEGIEQLRWEAGERQVEGAQVAVCSTGGGVPSSAWLLRRG